MLNTRVERIKQNGNNAVLNKSAQPSKIGAATN